MSVEFSAELKRIGQLVTDYILSYPEIAKVKPDYLREGVLFYVQKGGKRLRPGLLWWACAAVGGSYFMCKKAANGCVQACCGGPVQR